MTAVRTKGPVLGRFFENYLHHTKGIHADEAFSLEAWQQEFVNDFYRVDAKGRRVFRLGVLGIPRGNGKSPLAAGIGLYELAVRTDSPDVYCIAGSKEQAQVVMEFARSFVETGPLIEEAGMSPYKRSIVSNPNRGVARVLASSGSLTHGLNPSAVIADELHAFLTAGQEELWASMWSALHKRPDSFALAISTAGYKKDSLLGRTYDEALNLPEQEDRFDGCLRIRRDVENGILFYWYGIPEHLHDDWENEELWRLVNPASWLSMEELRKSLNTPGVDIFDWQRLHANMWTAARDTWLPVGTWRGLADVDATIPDEAEVFAGVDVGWNHDSTAVGLAWRRPDGKVIVKASRVWTTDPEQLGEYVPGGTMKLELVEDHLRTIARVYNLREIGFDPKYFGRSAQLLAREGMNMVEYQPSAGPMRNAWQAFYQAACEGRLVHDGDRVLAAHVDAAVKVTGEHGVRITKLGSDKIDALSAVVMALDGLQVRGAEKKKPNIFWLDL